MIQVPVGNVWEGTELTFICRDNDADADADAAASPVVAWRIGDEVVNATEVVLTVEREDDGIDVYCSVDGVFSPALTLGVVGA